MEQNQYPNQNGMPPAGMPYPQNGQVPHNGMPYQQPPMQQGMPQGMPYPNGNMNFPPNMPPQQNVPANNKKPKKQKKAKSKKSWITLGIFAVLGIIIGIFAFSIVNRYAKQLTVIELPGAPIIASTSNTSTVDSVLLMLLKKMTVWTLRR